MRTLKQDLMRRMLLSLTFIASVQWGLFIVYHVLEYRGNPEHLWEEIEEVGLLFGILFLGFPVMFYTVVRITKSVTQPLQNLSMSAIEQDPETTQPIEMDDRYREIQSLRMSINQALYRYHGALEQAKRFGGDASHQLRTPLAVIRSACEVGLTSERKSEEYVRILEEVLVESSRMETIVHQLQLLARLDRGEINCTERVELKDMKEALEDRLNPIIENRQVRLEVDAKSEFVIRGNAALLEEALFNLLENAVLAVEDQGLVRLRMDAHEDAIVFDVEDDGPGIAPEERKRIFERFYRRPVTAYEGSGLGLSIAQSIAELHGGAITLIQGADTTCFRMTLPQQ